MVTDVDVDTALLKEKQMVETPKGGASLNETQVPMWSLWSDVEDSTGYFCLRLISHHLSGSGKLQKKRNIVGRYTLKTDGIIHFAANINLDL